MAYYVRSIDKLANFQKVVELKDQHQIDADIITRDLKTTGNALSIWRIDSYDMLEDAIFCMSLSRSDFSGMTFIIIEEELLEKFDLSIKPSKNPYEGIVKNNRSKHYDIFGLTLEHLLRVMGLYAAIGEKDAKLQEGYFVKSYLKDAIKQMSIEACKQKRIDIERTEAKMRARLENLT